MWWSCLFQYEETMGIVGWGRVYEYEGIWFDESGEEDREGMNEYFELMN